MQMQMQVLVTESSTLRDQARRDFFGQLGVDIGPEAAQAHCAESSKSYKRLQNVPETAWPLFLQRREFLVLLDYSLPLPYFPRSALSAMLCNVLQQYLLSHADTLFLPQPESLACCPLLDALNALTYQRPAGVHTCFAALVVKSSAC